MVAEAKTRTTWIAEENVKIQNIYDYDLVQKLLKRKVGINSVRDKGDHENILRMILLQITQDQRTNQTFLSYLVAYYKNGDKAPRQYSDLYPMLKIAENSLSAF